MSAQDRSPDPNEPAAPVPVEIAVRVNPQPAPGEPRITLHESDLLEHLSSPEVQERMERVHRKLKEPRQQEAEEASKEDSDQEPAFIVSDVSVEEDGEGFAMELTMPDPDALLDMDIEGFDRDGLHQAPEAAFDAAQEEIEAGQKRERRDSLADTVFRLIELDEQGNETEGRELTLPEVAEGLGMTVEECEQTLLEVLQSGIDFDRELGVEDPIGAEPLDYYWELRPNGD